MCHIPCRFKIDPSNILHARVTTYFRNDWKYIRVTLLDLSIGQSVALVCLSVCPHKQVLSLLSVLLEHFSSDLIKKM